MIIFLVLFGQAEQLTFNKFFKGNKMQTTTADRLMRLDEVLKKIGIKKTNFYEKIKFIKHCFENENDELKKEEIKNVYSLISPKKFGARSLWSFNQLQQFIDLTKNGDIEKILNYAKHKNVA